VRYAFGLLVVGLLGHAIEAEAINLTPEQTGCTSSVGSTLDAGAVQAELDRCFDVSSASLELIYYRDVNAGEAGAYADSYATAFSPSRAAGNLTYSMPGPSFVCVECYLVFMDGTQSPAQYLFEITGWDGSESITFRNFWPGPGSIANVALWGSSTEAPLVETFSFAEASDQSRKASVPEPTTFMLIGLGTIGAIRAVRRRSPAAPATTPAK
jgi:hypothetical protein